MTVRKLESRIHTGTFDAQLDSWYCPILCSISNTATICPVNSLFVISANIEEHFVCLRLEVVTCDTSTLTSSAEDHTSILCVDEWCYMKVVEEVFVWQRKFHHARSIHLQLDGVNPSSLRLGTFPINKLILQPVCCEKRPRWRIISEWFSNSAHYASHELRERHQVWLMQILLAQTKMCIHHMAKYYLVPAFVYVKMKLQSDSQYQKLIQSSVIKRKLQRFVDIVPAVWRATAQVNCAQALCRTGLLFRVCPALHPAFPRAGSASPKHAGNGQLLNVDERCVNKNWADITEDTKKVKPGKTSRKLKREKSSEIHCMLACSAVTTQIHRHGVQ